MRLLPARTPRRPSRARGTRFALLAAAAVAAVPMGTPVAARAQVAPGYTFTPLHQFSGPDGYNPYAGLTRNARGDLYGVTVYSQNGGGGAGTLFKIAQGGGFTTLANFGSNGGGNPFGPVTLDGRGDVIGTLQDGPGGASLFRYAADTGALTTLAVLHPGTFAEPFGRLITDARGNLYGTTRAGGSDRGGSVFMLANNGTVAAPVYADAVTTLASFALTPSGQGGPEGGLVLDAQGDLYGTTKGGGQNNLGSVFKIANRGTADAPLYDGTADTLYSFGFLSGFRPSGSLVLDDAGNLYGTAQNAVFSNGGSVWKLSTQGGNFSVVAPFSSSDRSLPQGGLTRDSQGNLYGTTVQGGEIGRFGTVFKIANTGTAAAPVYSSAAATLYSFDGPAGAYPFGDVIVDASGNLYGTTGGGGQYASGTVFRLSPDGAVASAPEPGALALLLPAGSSTLLGGGIARRRRSRRR